MWLTPPDGFSSFKLIHGGRRKQHPLRDTYSQSAHLAADITQQSHAQVVLLHESGVVSVTADPDHFCSGLLKLRKVGLERLGLFRAAWRAVLGVEENLVGGVTLRRKGSFWSS